MGERFEHEMSREESWNWGLHRGQRGRGAGENVILLFIRMESVSGCGFIILCD